MILMLLSDSIKTVFPILQGGAMIQGVMDGAIMNFSITQNQEKKMPGLKMEN